MEMTTGVFIHEVDSKMDNGRIIYDEEFPIEFCPTLDETGKKTISRTYRKAADVLRHTCENFETLSQ